MIKPLNKKYMVYCLFLFINVYILVYNILNKSQWALDSIAMILISTIILLLSKKLKLTPEGFFFLHFGLLLHNLGSFGLYAENLGSFGYDNLVHLTTTMSLGYVFFNFLSRKLTIRKDLDSKNHILEYKIIMFFLVIASVTLFATLTEVVEFGGFLYLGDGEGLFFIGIGDSNIEGGSIDGQFVDTMTDILVNFLGSIIGVILFYNFRFKNKNYMRYK